MFDWLSADYAAADVRIDLHTSRNLLYSLMELPKFIASEKNIIIPVSKFDVDGTTRKLVETTFQLHFLCDIPILTFHFKKAWDVEVIPVNFRLLETWPESRNLVINLQLSDPKSSTSVSVKQIILNADDTRTIMEAKTEQSKMTLRQIDAIIDLIYSDYFGFTELREVSKKVGNKSVGL